MVWTPTERVQQRTSEVPVPQIAAEAVAVGKLALHELVQQRIVEETVEVVSLAPT